MSSRVSHIRGSYVIYVIIIGFARFTCTTADIHVLQPRPNERIDLEEASPGHCIRMIAARGVAVLLHQRCLLSLWPVQCVPGIRINRKNKK